MPYEWRLACASLAAGAVMYLHQADVGVLHLLQNRSDMSVNLSSCFPVISDDI